MSVASVVSVVQAVVAVVSVAQSFMSANAAKDQAKRQQQLEEERLALQAQQRNLQLEREKAQANRTARVNAARIWNTAAAQGAQFSSAAQGAASAALMGAQRENDYLSQVGAIGAQADAITRQQISLDAQAQIARANAERNQAVFRGVASLAESGYNIYRQWRTGTEDVPQPELPDSPFANVG